MWLPAVLHALAFATCLFVQTTSSPLAGSWLFFHLSGCAVLLYGAPRERKGALWRLTLAWLVILGASAFLITPVLGGATFFWILAAMPTLALCLRSENIPYYLVTFGIVGMLYAIGLGAQMFMQVHYTNYDYGGRMAWPLLDPNNAGLLINMALIPCFAHRLRHSCAVDIPLIMLLIALVATGSITAWICAGCACAALLIERFGRLAAFSLSLMVSAAGLYASQHGLPALAAPHLDALLERGAIYAGALKLLAMAPFTGLGIGSYIYYYPAVRLEQTSSGWHCHNDLLQIAIEMGVPAALFLIILLSAHLRQTTRRNCASACVIAVVLVQSLLEFQFYVPSISLCMGLVLACHRCNIGKRAI